MSLSDSSIRPSVKYELLDPDVRLMMRVKEGSAVAYEQLVERYQLRVIQFFQNSVSVALAEDLAQEVFLRIYRARESYQPDARFATWLFTIAHNVASNAIRKLAQRKEVQVESADSQARVSLDALAKASSGLMPTRQLDRQELSQVVKLAMNGLNERQRTAILLSKFENLSYQEIADAMGLTVKAVKSLLSRARLNLRDALQPYMNQGLNPGRFGQAPATDDEDLDDPDLSDE